jgi:hypothetical protein
VIKVLNHHNRNLAAEKKAIAIIDRDNLPLSEANDNVFRSPDGAPESFVLEYIFLRMLKVLLRSFSSAVNAQRSRKIK